MIVERGVSIPMRDGVRLHADVYRPDDGTPVPAVLNRTPYDRSLRLTPLAALDPDTAAAEGFALVCQDVRGRHGSGGEFYPFGGEGADGYDSVEWVAAQPWCNGAVTMAGRSYSAETQWLAAAERPPHLRAIAPVVTGCGHYDNWVYQGGAFQLGFNLFWVQLISGLRGSLRDHYRHLPITSPPVLDGVPARRFYRDWLAHPTNDEFWRRATIRGRHGCVGVPALIVGGWYDLLLAGTLENFVRLRLEGASPAAREGTRLLIGPWAHGSTYGPYPDHSFDASARADVVDLARLQLDFFARQLAGEKPAPEEAPVRIFVMGANRWREEEDWPLARARATRWFLRAGGDGGDGRLSRQPPSEEAPDEFLYDPRDPAPTIGGPTSLPARLMRTNSGPLDQRLLEARGDVLVYSSDPLPRPLEVTGPLSVVVHAATSGHDTDFVAKLCDVAPDGFSRILAEGVLRGCFVHGFDAPRPLEPGRAYEYTIDLVATSNVFLAGHRIRLLVTSSSFPRFDRNSNSGKAFEDVRDDDLEIARQSIFHDAARPSHVLLPLVEH